MRIPRIEIERKTDILALAAFLLSAGPIVVQVGFFIRGPDVKLHPSNMVTFRAVQLQPGDTERLRLAATMAYTNSGAPGYDAVIQKELIAIHLGSDAVYRQQWKTFESFDVSNGKLVKIERKPANPLPVYAGGGVSHDTYFTPFYRRCETGQEDCDQWHNYITWPDFKDRVANIKEIKVTLTGVLYGEEDTTASCMVSVDDNMRYHLQDKGWYSARCWPMEH